MRARTQNHLSDLRTYVLNHLSDLRTYVLNHLLDLRTYVLNHLLALRTYVLNQLSDMRTYVPNHLLNLRTYVLNHLLFFVLIVVFLTAQILGCETRYSSSIWGPTCDGLDCITNHHMMPELEVGDWILFENMGAYTMSASSTFNGMAKPKGYYVIGLDEL